MQRVVCTFGVFDLLHIGHVRFLEKCRSWGHRLIVGVPEDRVVELDKGRPPVIPFTHRLEMVRSIWCVTVAVGYEELEFLTVLKMFRPDVLAVGTWGTDRRHREAEEFVESYDGKVIRIPYTPGVSTTSIIASVKEKP
jgi:rfaE bifunctional protein nucleotidyltransferase chain/domain